MRPLRAHARQTLAIEEEAGAIGARRHRLRLEERDGHGEEYGTALGIFPARQLGNTVAMPPRGGLYVKLLGTRYV